MGYKLTPFGAGIVRKGGHDDQSPDDMLVLELVQRAPGLSINDMQALFVAVMEEYGEDALAAVRAGCVQFEEMPGGTRPETTERHK